MKLLLSIFLLLPTCVYAGNEGGHGGDTYSQEFSSIGLELAKTFKDINITRMGEYKFSYASFKKAVQNVNLSSDEKDKVYIEKRLVDTNGHVTIVKEEKDAINYPDQNRILINRTRWREAVLAQKIQLVMHEYFGILNVERDNFNVSYEFKDVLVTTLNRILAEPDLLLTNLFYGRCVKAPPLSRQGKICEDNKKELIECATEQATSRCKSLSPASSCQLVVIESDRKIADSGFQFCEATAVVK